MIHADPEIAGLTADSRAVRPGFLFAALPGAKADGRRFIPDAVANGAVAVLAGELRGLEGLPVPVVVDANPRRRLSLMAARFHGGQPKTIAAITGTNGKTSVASFTRQIWAKLGYKAASLGTLGLVAPGIERPGSLTTPDPIALHRDLADLAQAGVDHVAMEASSHGLDQFRLDGVQVSLAAFTNLTRDHLDYHGSMAAYFTAKSRLFDSVMASGGVAVLNADAPEFEVLAQICRRRGHRIIAYGERADAELRLLGRRPTASGQLLTAEVLGRSHRFELPLAGAFQAMNALAALGLAIGGGAEPDAALAALTELQGVPGRIQRVATHPGGAPIYVDYAHTPDALETVLRALRPHAEGRLVLVFGCGGDRDAGKRPVMGEIASRLADAAIVTDDNPRSEPPASIRAAILAGCPDAAEIGDRAVAIRHAVAGLGPKDLLVIAGKGHERGQIVNGVVHPFDDADVARRAVAELSEEAQ